MLWPVSAKAIVIQDGAVLLGRNDRDEWELPGGRVERAEEPAAAVVREVEEETGLHVVVTTLLGARRFEVLPDRYVLVLGYACALVEHAPLVVSEEHGALAWHRLDRLDEIALPEVYRDLLAPAARRRVVLLGDSHLAKLDQAASDRLRETQPDRPLIVNRAVGGSSVLDVLSGVEPDPVLPRDVSVLSVGTNDYAPWKRVPLDRFTRAVGAVLDRLRLGRVIVLLPPEVDEARQRSAGRTLIRTSVDRAPYADAVRAASARVGATVVEIPREATAGADGVHLDADGYDVLLDLLARALG
ncbi:NUDIX domain-containing protein [Amnibacterium setariae]|uniref:NUDIX domain-containing protein n=1 Tax=Amnibacterium setariae TaxID=2306585 RepID=A0A3A1TW57_9MICO|nr:NUDIX domain-containing protein [Amnibacterium setariae]RIX28029.1 NUDIX domain-containing protein [Amnibacterium setariae]